MSLWKIKHNKPQKINETNFHREKLLEENLENWVALDPSLLGEPLLIIGRQVLIPDTKDRLDLLALDPQALVRQLGRSQEGERGVADRLQRAAPAPEPPAPDAGRVRSEVQL